MLKYNLVHNKTAQFSIHSNNYPPLQEAELPRGERRRQRRRLGEKDEDPARALDGDGRASLIRQAFSQPNLVFKLNISFFVLYSLYSTTFG